MITLPKESDFELTPAGSHVAVCYRVVDYGTQESNYKGKQTFNRKIMIGWELPNEKMKDGKSFIIFRSFNLSSSKKGNLRPFLESWRGKAFTPEELGKFDISKLVGVPALLSIVHEAGEDGETRANLKTAMGLPKGTPIPAIENEKFSFSLENFDQFIFDKLSENTQAKIKLSPEYQRLFANGVSSAGPIAAFNGEETEEDGLSF